MLGEIHVHPSETHEVQQMKVLPDRPRFFRAAVGLGIIALTAACGTSTSGSGGTATSPPPSAAAGVALEEGTASVMNAQETVLTSPTGFTLYYLTVDTANAPKCTGSCLTQWPPLLTNGSPTSMMPLSGALTVAMNANGDQVAYNGHLLYTFSGDKAKGDAKGEGTQAFGGVWKVATPSLTLAG
jgi:predicted lipoprotein with Yx(FWY)xxD motif